MAGADDDVTISTFLAVGLTPCAVAVPPPRRAVDVCASTQIGRQPEDEMMEHELVAWRSHCEPSETASQILHVSSRLHSPSGCVAVGGALCVKVH